MVQAEVLRAWRRAQESVRILPKPLVQMPRFVAFSKGDTQRAEQFAQALQRVQQAGGLEDIYQRWQ